MKLLDGLSTSAAVSVPVAVGVSYLASPSSITEPVVSPEMMAASLLPLMVTVTSCGVPSTVVTVNVSVSLSPTLSACTAWLVLSSV